MARPRITSIEGKKDEIHVMYAAGKTIKQILDALKEEHNCPVSIRTLTRRLQSWGLYGIRNRRVAKEDRYLMQLRIMSLSNGRARSDEDVLQALQTEGFNVGSLSVVRRMRKSLGIKKAHPQDDQNYNDFIRHTVAKYLADGSIGGFGRRQLYTHFKNMGINIPRERLFAAKKEFDRLVREDSDQQEQERRLDPQLQDVGQDCLSEMTVAQHFAQAQQAVNAAMPPGYSLMPPTMLHDDELQPNPLHDPALTAPP